MAAIPVQNLSLTNAIDPFLVPAPTPIRQSNGTTPSFSETLHSARPSQPADDKPAVNKTVEHGSSEKPASTKNSRDDRAKPTDSQTETKRPAESEAKDAAEPVTNQDDTTAESEVVAETAEVIDKLATEGKKEKKVAKRSESHDALGAAAEQILRSLPQKDANIQVKNKGEGEEKIAEVGDKKGKPNIARGVIEKLIEPVVANVEQAKSEQPEQDSSEKSPKKVTKKVVAKQEKVDAKDEKATAGPVAPVKEVVAETNGTSATTAADVPQPQIRTPKREKGTSAPSDTGPVKDVANIADKRPVDPIAENSVEPDAETKAAVKRSAVERLTSDTVKTETSTPKDSSSTAERAASPRFAQHLVGHTTETNNRGATNGVDQTRFVDRVAKALQAADGKSGQLRLRLHPPELGALKLEVQIRGGVMNAKIEAEQPGTQTLLMDSLPQLRERLAEQGVRIETFDVGLMNQQPGGDQTNLRDRHSGEQRRSSTNRGLEGEAEGAEATSNVANAQHAGNLNVII